MRIVLLGDFSGRGNRDPSDPGSALAERRLLSLDIDNFDSRLGSLAPRLVLPLGGPEGPEVSLEVGGLDDFHPDVLYRRLEVFQGFRETRKQLLDPATASQALAEISSLSRAVSPEEARVPVEGRHPAAPPGHTGPEAPAGHGGPTGAAGPPGPAVPAGHGGSTGAAGPPGPPGPSGPAGPVGPSGRASTAGPAGPGAHADSSDSAIASGPTAPGAPAPAESDRATLERLFGKGPSGPAGRRKASGTLPGGLEAFLRRLVAPYVLPSADPRREALLDALDGAAGAVMRNILHHPRFQALEASWRSARRLAAGLETGEGLQLFLLDVSRRELREDLERTNGDPDRTSLARLLIRESEERGGEGGWVLAGDFVFGETAEDLQLLGALGAISSKTGAPFLAAAHPRLLGCDSLADHPEPTEWNQGDAALGEAWQALRRSAVAPGIGLALPRLLIRLPYGARTDPIESFPFEELPPGSPHEAYLWGSPAFACAELLARAFLERGWSMEPGDVLDLSELPAHVYEEAGERRTKPCAEVLLGERASDAILKASLMPLMSYRGRNQARLARFQSIADPPAALSGPWARN